MSFSLSTRSEPSRKQTLLLFLLRQDLLIRKIDDHLAAGIDDPGIPVFADPLRVPVFLMHMPVNEKQRMVEIQDLSDAVKTLMWQIIGIAASL